MIVITTEFIIYMGPLDRLKRFFSSTKDLFVSVENGLKSLSEASTIEIADYKKELKTLKDSFESNVGLAQEPTETTENTEQKMQTGIKNVNDRMKIGEEFFEVIEKLKSAKNNLLDQKQETVQTHSLKDLYDTKKYNAILFKQEIQNAKDNTDEQTDIQNNYTVESLINAIKSNYDLNNQEVEYLRDNNQQIKILSLINKNTTLASTIKANSDEYKKAVAAEVTAAATTEVANLMIQAKDLYGKINQSDRAVNTYNLNFEKTNDPYVIDGYIEKLSEAFRGLEKPTIEHQQCNTYLTLIDEYHKNICSTMQHKGKIETNLAFAKHLENDNKLYTNEDEKADAYKNFLYRLDGTINDKEKEQESTRKKNEKEYNKLADKITKNIEEISSFFAQETKPPTPYEYEKKIQELTKNMQNSVLQLNNAIQKLNIDKTEKNLDSNIISNYNTLNVGMNKVLNSKIKDLNAEVAKTYTQLKENTQDDKILKNINDLILKVEKFKCNDFVSRNGYDNLQKEIKTIIDQNTQNTNGKYNVRQIYKPNPNSVSGVVTTQIIVLKNLNDNLSKSINTIESLKKNSQTQSQKYLQRKKTVIGLF